MSVHATISALQQGSAADLNFVREMRHGLNEILDGMEDVCHRRDNSFHELEEEMQDNGHLLRSDLINEVEALKREKRALTEELNSLRAQSETIRSVRSTTQRNITQAGLSMSRRTALAEVVNIIGSNTEIAHDYFESKRREMKDELTADDLTITTGNLHNAEQHSTELKRSLNNLVDMTISSENYTVAQDLRDAMKRWGNIHRCLATERKSARMRYDKHYEYTIMALEYLALLRGGISNLQDVSAELRKRNGESSSQQRSDIESEGASTYSRNYFERHNADMTGAT